MKLGLLLKSWRHSLSREEILIAERQGKCINFGLCSKAYSREIIPVASGGDFTYPKCGKALNEAAGASGSGRGAGKGAGGKKAMAIGALGLALIAGTAYKFLAEPDKGDKLADVKDTGGIQNRDESCSAGSKRADDSQKIRPGQRFRKTK